MSSRLEELKLMLAEDPSDSFLQYVYALELEKSGNPEVAIKVLQQVLSTDPGYLAAYYQLARILQSEGSVEEAIELLHIGIRVAIEQKNRHTLAELRYLLSEISGEDE